MKTDKSSFGLRIKDLRIKKRLTQDEVAGKLGIVKATVSAWENGISSPSIDKLIKLSDILGVTVNDLTGNMEIIDLPEVQDFGTKYNCQECKAKDMEIQLLRERIEELKDFNEYLKKKCS